MLADGSGHPAMSSYTTESSFWNVEYYRKYFDVDTAEVGFATKQITRPQGGATLRLVVLLNSFKGPRSSRCQYHPYTRLFRTHLHQSRSLWTLLGPNNSHLPTVCFKKCGAVHYQYNGRLHLLL